MTDEEVGIDVYWAAVSYKDLHTNLIKAGDVVNLNIKQPLNVPELVGYVKMYGWEYEKEVRLCVITSKPLKDNEKIAVKLPSDFLPCIVTGPGFDTQKNRKKISVLKIIAMFMK